MIKTKDLIYIIIATVAAFILSLTLSKVFFKYNPSTQTVEQVPAITSNFPDNNSKLFQNLTIDPTVLIHIDNNSNGSVFSQAN